MVEGVLKFVGGLVITIALIAAIVYGGWILVSFIGTVIAGGLNWEMTRDYLQGLMLTGGDLALLFLAWVKSKEYFDDKDYNKPSIVE